MTNIHLYNYRTALKLLCFRLVVRFVSPDVCLVVVLVIIVIYYLLLILYYIILLSPYKTRQWTGWRRVTTARALVLVHHEFNLNLIRFPCPSPIPWTVYGHRRNYLSALLLIGRWRALSVVFVVPTPTCSMTNIVIIIIILLYVNRSTSGKYSSIPLTVGIILLCS